MELIKFQNNLEALYFIRRTLTKLLELKNSVCDNETEINFFVAQAYWERAEELNYQLDVDDEDDAIWHFFKEDQLFHKLILNTASALHSVSTSLMSHTKLTFDIVSQALLLVEELCDQLLPELDERIKFLQLNPDKVISAPEDAYVENQDSHDSINSLLHYKWILERFSNFRNEIKSKEFCFSGWAITNFWEHASNLHSEVYCPELQNLIEHDEWVLLSTCALSIFKPAYMLMSSKKVSESMFELAVNDFTIDLEYVNSYVNKLIAKYKSVAKKADKQPTKKVKSEE